MWRIKAFLRKRWRVEAYHTKTGKPCGLAAAVLPDRTFWTKKMAEHEAWALNNLAGLQDAKHRYRVVPL